jgi:spermidine synthase
MPTQGRRSKIRGGKKKGPSVTNHPLPVPIVSQQGDVLTLHFGSNYIQSQMIVGKPDFLAFAYTRTMMAFEMLIPQPREIALIGLGGGSIAKWCYRHHQKTKLTVVEINPQVIAIREAFQIPEDDQKFRVICEDGAKFVAKTSARFDVLLADCFAADHLPPELCSQEFYDHCNRALTESGLMVANLCVKNVRRILSRINKSFNWQTLVSTDRDGNTVVFACRENCSGRKAKTQVPSGGSSNDSNGNTGLAEQWVPRDKPDLEVGW